MQVQRIHNFMLTKGYSENSQPKTMGVDNKYSTQVTNSLPNHNQTAFGSEVYWPRNSFNIMREVFDKALNPKRVIPNRAKELMLIGLMFPPKYTDLLTTKVRYGIREGVGIFSNLKTEDLFSILYGGTSRPYQQQAGREFVHEFLSGTGANGGSALIHLANQEELRGILKALGELYPTKSKQLEEFLSLLIIETHSTGDTPLHMADMPRTKVILDAIVDLCEGNTEKAKLIIMTLLNRPSGGSGAIPPLRNPLTKIGHDREAKVQPTLDYVRAKFDDETADDLKVLIDANRPVVEGSIARMQAWNDEAMRIREKYAATARRMAGIET
ncbi:MAG: hypothetical protein PHC64_02810 [Candidatus Gastranaerophilales bacterium]|nr:hypothetical protein [Candidatus Gastranaerophilales bacterium]